MRRASLDYDKHSHQREALEMIREESREPEGARRFIDPKSGEDKPVPREKMIVKGGEDSVLGGWLESMPLEDHASIGNQREE
eukprot:1662503-Heterocapsa_arctica.AAC.1